MGNLMVPENPEYTEEIRKFETTDPAHADLLNQVAQALLNNEAFLKRLTEQHIGSQDNPHNITKEAVGLGNVPNVATNDQAPTFTQAAARENIGSGEKLSIIFGKIKKWLADLKAVAFTGSYNDLANKPTIPAASTATPAAAGTATAGTSAAYARGDHVHPLQTSVSGSSGSCTGNAATATKATQDGDGNVIKDTYAKKSIYGNTVVSMGRKPATTEGTNSFAFGNLTTASGKYSYAIGHRTTASGYASCAEGYETTAIGQGSHTEGYNAIANSNYSHAEGSHTTANSSNSHAEGSYTTANNYAAHVCGKHNKPMLNGGEFDNQLGDVFVIGNGTGESSRSNALRITYTGDILGTKAFQSSGADYAEHFEKKTGIGEDWVGHFVTMKDGYIYKANEGDYILGIVSGNPSIIGNSDEDYYWRYERDEFNRIVMEDVPELIQKTDEDGNVVFDEETHEPIMIETGNIVPNARMKLAEGYDPTLQDTYIPREKRDEWECVGMLGVIPVRDDDTCIPGQFCKCGTGGIATLAEGRGVDSFFVIERISDNVVSVIIR